MKKYISNLFLNNYKFLFKTINNSKSVYKINFINLTIKKNIPLGKKNQSLNIPIDEIVAPRIFKNNNWDYFIINFIKKNMSRKNLVFFDIGANIGLISRQLQNLNLPIKKYYCFEPELNSYNILKKNLISNKTYFFNYGLGKRNKTVKFLVNHSNKSDHSIYHKKYSNRVYSFARINLKNSNTILLRLINKHKIKNIIYKSDTQGNDEEIFTNLGEKIINKINILIIEISNFDFLKKNLDLFFSKIKYFKYLYNCNGNKINLIELKILINKQEEFNLMAKK